MAGGTKSNALFKFIIDSTCVIGSGEDTIYEVGYIINLCGWIYVVKQHIPKAATNFTAIITLAAKKKFYP
jgi:hypothetical protein